MSRPDLDTIMERKLQGLKRFVCEVEGHRQVGNTETLVRACAASTLRMVVRDERELDRLRRDYPLAFGVKPDLAINRNRLGEWLRGRRDPIAFDASAVTALMRDVIDTADYYAGMWGAVKRKLAAKEQELAACELDCRRMAGTIKYLREKAVPSYMPVMRPLDYRFVEKRLTHRDAKTFEKMKALDAVVFDDEGTYSTLENLLDEEGEFHLVAAYTAELELASFFLVQVRQVLGGRLVVAQDVSAGTHPDHRGSKGPSLAVAQGMLAYCSLRGWAPAYQSKVPAIDYLLVNLSGMVRTHRVIQPEGPDLYQYGLPGVAVPYLHPGEDNRPEGQYKTVTDTPKKMADLGKKWVEVWEGSSRILAMPASLELAASL